VSRRAVTNDRYKKDNFGTTRKSAASVKPKREAGEAASAQTNPKPKAKAKGPARTAAKKPASSARVPDSPEVKRLRKWWWGFMGAALLIAFLLVPITSNKTINQRFGSIAVGVYAATLGVALYLEFGPIRRARAAAIAAAKKDEKSGAKPGGKPGGAPKSDKAAPPVAAVTSAPSWLPSWWPFGKPAKPAVSAKSGGSERDDDSGSADA
jgi:hypothetical protein